MRITKFGHSCLYVEDSGVRILIDPGNYCFLDMPLKPEDIPACDVLLLTHEHPDHTYPEALKVILQKSAPRIITNAGVRNVLQEHGIESEILGRGEEIKVGNVTIGGVGLRGVACDHAEIAPHIPRVENIGFMIAGRLFHPGDCIAPSESVSCEILAAPVAAPWMKISEGLEFVKAIKPKFAIPIHDGFFKNPERPWYMVFETGLKDTDIQFLPMKIGEPKEF